MLVPAAPEGGGVAVSNFGWKLTGHHQSLLVLNGTRSTQISCTSIVWNFGCHYPTCGSGRPNGDSDTQALATTLFPDVPLPLVVLIRTDNTAVKAWANRVSSSSVAGQNLLGLYAALLTDFGSESNVPKLLKSALLR